MKTCYILAGIFACIAILHLASTAYGQEHYSQTKFFTTERFLLAAQILEAVTADRRAKKDLRIFTKYFNDGAYAVSNGNYQTALNSLYKARRLWPEYFGTDFLIALSLERKGNIKQAARFYKAYLDKLKTLESGYFPISAPLIKGLNVGAVDTYSISKIRIEDHLKKYDIELAHIKAPFFMPPLMKVALLLFFGTVVGIIIYYTVVPYLKVRSRIKNTPPGYWVCRRCGKINPDLLKECAKCAFGNQRSSG